MLLFLGGLAMAGSEPRELKAFWGFESGAAGPVYFGVQGGGGLAVGPWRARLDGRLRLGALAAAEGEAWLGLDPAGPLRLRAGFAPWFAAPPAEGRAWGGRADFELGGPWRFAVAGEAFAALGGGVGYESGALAAWLWARSDGPAFYLQGSRGAWGVAGWYRAGYASLLAPRRAGLRLDWRMDPWSVRGGWRSDTGFFLGSGWQGPVRLDLEGRWYPGRAAAAGMRAEYPLAPGVTLAGRFDQAFRPFHATAWGLELRVDAYAAPASQGE